jgi:hypothetical protein
MSYAKWLTRTPFVARPFETDGSAFKRSAVASSEAQAVASPTVIPIAVKKKSLQINSDCCECSPGWPLVYCKTPQTLFGSRANACGRLGEDARAKIENRHCGDFCGDLLYILAHLATS